MGWDAHSSAKINWNIEGGQIMDPVIRNRFRNANNYVMRKAGAVDGFLKNGSLDLSISGEMLERATGASVYDDKPWNAEIVWKLFKAANWKFPIAVSNEWERCGYWSARKFLEVCAKSGLSIKFSW